MLINYYNVGKRIKFLLFFFIKKILKIKKNLNFKKNFIFKSTKKKINSNK